MTATSGRVVRANISLTLDGRYHGWWGQVADDENADRATAPTPSGWSAPRRWSSPRP